MQDNAISNEARHLGQQQLLRALVAAMPTPLQEGDMLAISSAHPNRLLINDFFHTFTPEGAEDLFAIYDGEALAVMSTDRGEIDGLMIDQLLADDAQRSDYVATAWHYSVNGNGSIQVTQALT